MIKAILFDIDGVLVDSVKANAQLYREVLGYFGFPGPSDEEQARNNHMPFIDNIRLYAAGATDEQVQRMFDYGVALTRDHSQLVLMDGVATTLDQLLDKYILGVVSSRIHPGIGSLLEHFALAKYFSVQVGYEDTEQHKPHPAPLLFAAEKLGLKPEELIYVGDAGTDVQAANAAKMKVILYSHAPLPGADQTVKSFLDIVGVVNTLVK